MAGKPQRKRSTQAQQALKDHGVVVTALVSAFIGVVVFGLLGWGLLGLTNPLLALLPPLAKFAFYVGAITFAVAWIYGFVIHDGADPASMHRARYLQFRAMLADNGVGSFYAKGVRRALAWIDRFFGDVPAPSTAPRLGLFPRTFGLRDPAPLWTANAYDRCLLLALIYPLLVVFLGWVVSGEALAVEQALGMRDAEPWERAVAVALIIFAVALMVMSSRLDGWEHPALFAMGLVVILATTAFGAGLAAFVFAFALAFLGFVAGTTAVAFAIAGVNLVASASAGASAFAVGVTVVATILATILFILNNPKGRSRLGFIFTLFTIIIFAVTIFAPTIAAISASQRILTLLFFFGLLTLVNAPFDWLALGISRGLLRRGLQQGGLAPLWLGLLDVLISLALMAVLAIAVLWSAELFDWMTLRGGNPPILDPEAMLDELRRYASLGNTHYWWLYAMLFSTQIPALVNLIFGVFCLLRGIGGLNERMLAAMPEEGAIEFWHKAANATVWSLQMGGAVSIGLLSVYFLFGWVLPVLDPQFGYQLIDVLDSMRILPIRPPGWLVPQ